MRKALIATAALGLIYSVSPAYAGFEFEPAPAPPPQAPMRLEQPPAAPPSGFSVAPMPVEPVEAQPLSPEPPMMAMPSPPPVDVPSRPTGPAPLVINPYPQQAAPAQADDQSLLQEMLRETGSLKPMPNLPKDVQQKFDQSHPTPPSYVHKRSYPEVQGFGRDLPLVIALSQIVPPDYTYSFSNQDDAGAFVSWQGGRPWDQVLADMLRPLDLRADIRGTRVSILQGAEDMAPEPMPVAYNDNSMPMPIDYEEAAPVPLPPAADYVAPAPVVIDPHPADAKMVSRSSDLMTSEQTDLGTSPRPLLPARVSRMNMEDTGHADMPMEKPSVPGPVAAIPLPPSDDGLKPIESKPLQLAPVPVAPVPAPQQEEDMAAMSMEPDMSPMPMPVQPKMPMDSKEWEAPAKLKMASVPSYSGSLNSVRTWRAVRGDSLKTVLSDWAQDAGVELYWSSEFDYPLDSSVRLKGTFEEAVQNILTGLRDARPRPIGRLHPNEPEGPAVLVIETQQIVE